jgi:hypothetical protein
MALSTRPGRPIAFMRHHPASARSALRGNVKRGNVKRGNVKH